MTSRVNEIPTLIADIDGLLANKGKRLNKILSQGQEARQVLEKIRDFLANLQHETVNSNSDHEQQSSPLLARFLNQGSSTNSSEMDGVVSQTKEEIQTLLEQKARLGEEVRELEQKRLQSYSLKQQVANQEQMISEFLQVLLNRITNGLPLQNLQTVSNTGSSQSLLAGENVREHQIARLEDNETGLSNSLDQLQHLNRLTSDLDQRLLALDGTVNAVFEALERNVNTYNESLSAAIARMHSQGIQSEELLNNFVYGLRERLLLGGEQEDISQQALPQQTSETKALSASAADLLPVESVNIATSFGHDEVNLFHEDNLSTVADNYQVTDMEVLGDKVSIPDLDAVSLDFDSVGSEDELIDTSSQISSSNSVSENSDHDTTSSKQGRNNSYRDEIEELYASLFDSEPTITPLNVSSQDKVVEELLNELDENTQHEEFVADSDTQTEENLERSDIGKQVEVLPVADTSNDIDEGNNHDLIESELNSEEHQESSKAQPELNRYQTTLADKNPLEVVETIKTNNLPDPWVAVDDTSAPAHSEVEESATGENENDSISDWNTFSLTEDTQENKNQENKTQDLVPEQRYDIFASETFDFGKNSLLQTTQEFTPEKEDTINLLTDLLDKPVNKSNSDNIKPNDANALLDVEKNSAPVTKEEVQFQGIIPQEIISNPKEEYISAPISENLLDEDTPTEEVPKKVILNSEQEQKLSSDLANFEKIKESPSKEETTPSTGLVDNRETVAEDVPETSLKETADTQLNISSIDTPISKEEQIEVSTQEVNTQQANTTSGNSQIIGSTVTNSNPLDSVWYLGIDIGTTGICAVLLNRSNQSVYPLYWQTNEGLQAEKVSSSFRLPAEVYLPTTASVQQGNENQHSQEQISPVSASEEEDTSQNAAKPNKSPHPLNNNLFSAKLKPYLNIALPYRSITGYVGEEAKHKWEPLLQMNELSVVPLVWVVRSLSKLLLTLKSDPHSTTLNLTAAADGLNAADFQQIIDNLAGVICNCPSNWTEQYRFNIREALINSKLIKHPQQVFFVEEAIASLLGELDGAAGEKVSFGGQIGVNYIKTSGHQFNGSTLIVNIGAGSTEMALVDIPEYLHELTHDDFMLHNFAYGGQGIEQDIVCQLLVSEKWRSPRKSLSPEETSNPNVKPWRWRSEASNLEKMRLSSLGLDNLELPKAGEPDTAARINLQRRLESSVLGQALMDAAAALKLILLSQESFTIELADQRWTLHRRDLEAQVFVPFVRRLNREINRLLVAKGIPTEAINQSILTGGVSGLAAVNRWLRQKLPNAKIIQDEHQTSQNIPQSTRVAYGLALLPLHPQVLEIPRQQYTDYFLFTELIRLLPSRTVSFGEIIQLFEERGINTRSCQERLLSFLEGKIPSGLIPTDSPYSNWITRGSLENSEYKSIQLSPIFDKQGSVSYKPNIKQLEHLRRFLTIVQSSTEQSLEEPYTVNFAVSNVRE